MLGLVPLARYGYPEPGPGEPAFGVADLDVRYQHVMADRDAAIARELNRLIEGT